MSPLEWTAAVALGLALLPLFLTVANLPFYRRPRQTAPESLAVSVLIPARNEEAVIGAAVEAALAGGTALEVIVLDDHSTDRTAAIVRGIAARDPRVRLASAPPLPPGWSGKQHACHLLAGLARHPVLLFQDADVRLAPGAINLIAGRLLAGDAGLVSGFPRQETRTMGEKLLVPLMLFLLIGYLPMAGMRLTRMVGFGAACGQLVAVRREAYFRAGGHAAIRDSKHDGLKLPRAFRRADVQTELFDASGLAVCRMYRGWVEAWRGFSKNATEGMATPVALPVWTMMLLGGHVLPWALIPVAAGAPGGGEALALAVAAAASGVGLRLMLAARFNQPLASAMLHPVGIALAVAIQWSALVASWRGRPVEWRGRAYGP